jgi:membrane-bound lytic murein transglycosylase MltF
LAGALATGATVPAQPQNSTEQSLLRDAQARTGDFDMMMETRVVRVLVPHSRTLFFNDKGKERGLSAENVRDFELYLNRKYKKKLRGRPITVLIIPTPRNQLLNHVVDGRGDVAVGNLTVTDERLKIVDFVAPPELRGVSEVLVTPANAPPVARVEALSGRTIHVRASSSYFESLETLNRMFERAGRDPVKIHRISEYLEDEDLMEMVDAGLLPAIIVDDWKAHMWQPVLPHIAIHDSVAVRTGGSVGWAFRHNSPLLQSELHDFFYKFEKQRGSIPYRFHQYSKQIKRLQDPTGREDWKRFQETVAIFQKYGDQYGFDPLMLVAQGYQESALDQSKRSRVGAIGVMQLMPETGASMKVGDVTVTDPNIHAGAKYLNKIMTDYFQDANFDDFNRALFALASYNAGPTRIARLRRQSAERGLDPDLWFDNVEVIVSEKVGRETTTYVRNIVKYYVSYRLTVDMQTAREAARERAAPGDGN